MTTYSSAPPEAELESRISATLQKVFPGTANIKGQRRFTLRLGHSDVRTNGYNVAEGRSDILVTSDAGVLAVLELKREGLALTDADLQQGASYALLARAPLIAAQWFEASGDRFGPTFVGQKLHPERTDAFGTGRRAQRTVS